MPSKPLPTEDLAHILTHTRSSFETLRDARIFLTGGTGFFGHWLLESLLYANRELSLNVRITALTRNAAAFRAKSPHITGAPALTLLEGDIATFTFPTELPTHILHAATDSGGQQASRTAEDLYNDILRGTQRVLDLASHERTKRLLYTSTGAVYGRSTTLLHTPEDFVIPNLPLHSYEAAKHAAELLCIRGYPEPLGSGLIRSEEGGALAPRYASAIIARCFAFVGPHLPLDAHFAIGNFIGAALKNEPIHIKGDGTPRRSWLYMADLAIWLWTLLAQGQPGRAYNVGSDDGMTIAEAATLVVETLSSRPEQQHPNLSSRPERSEVERPLYSESARMPAGLPIQIDGTPNPLAPLNSYVPDITRAGTELGLKVTIPLAEALRRTAAWHR